MLNELNLPNGFPNVYVALPIFLAGFKLQCIVNDISAILNA